MEAPDRILRRRNRRSKCCLWGIGVLVLLVILAIVIPLAVILPQRTNSKGVRSTILLPLYIYPMDDSWNPLTNAISSHSNLNFTVIVNVDSGPGSSQLPNDDFAPQIQKLNTYSNVRTVGYVRTNYTLRNITEVLQDVSTYAGWSKANLSLAVHGIFFDEMPSEFSQDAFEYSKSINQAVKNSSGLLGDKIIIHNPGTPPDNRLWDDTTDITVSFEQSYKLYGQQQSTLSSLPQDRSRYCFMTHSVPSGWSTKSLKEFVDKQSRHAEYLFVTDNSKDYYESFGGDWKTFVDVMPT